MFVTIRNINILSDDYNIEFLKKENMILNYNKLCRPEINILIQYLFLNKKSELVWTIKKMQERNWNDTIIDLLRYHILVLLILPYSQRAKAERRKRPEFLKSWMIQEKLKFVFS